MLLSSLFRHAAVVFCAGAALLPRLHAQSEVKLNEVLAKNDSWLFWDGSRTDWVELYNTSSQPVDLGNASLTDDQATPRKWTFAAGVTIPANGYLVVLCDDSTSASLQNTAPLNTGFQVKAGGGGIWFYPRGGGTVPLDGVTFGFQAGDFSIGRLPNGTGSWSLNTPTAVGPNQAQALGSASAVRINEWMADPASGDDWFELYNPGNLPVALGGYFLTDKPAEPALSPIPPLSFIGVEQNAYAQIWADDNVAAGANHAAFGLSRSGDTILISNASAQPLDVVTFGPQVEGISQGRMPDGSANLVNMPPGGSPEDSNYLLFSGLIVSELLSHTDPPLEDAVEFYNRTDAPIDISGWYLSNAKSDLKRYRIPDGTVVPARGYLVIYENQFGAALPPAGFTFNSARGDQVYLAQADASGNLTGYRVSEEFEPAANGVTFGRYETSVAGDYKFVALRRPTFGVAIPKSLSEFRTGAGAPNTGPSVGPVVINEIMYNPLSLDGINDNTVDEYVELRNITPFSVPLYDPNYPTNHWRLRDAVSYRFPAGSSIPPFGYALVVSFDPDQNTAQATAFRNKFAVPALVKIYGPYEGQLSNGGEGVELYRPDTPQGPTSPDAGLVPYVRVDKVNYDDELPWPTGPDGTGQVLRRKDGFAFGNDPINWEAAAPSAGKGNYPELEDRDHDGLPNVWETSANLNPDSASDAGLDSDLDGLSNLFEYATGTDPRNATSALGLSIAESGTGSPAVLSFQAMPGRAYVIEARNALQLSVPWEPVAFIDPRSTEETIQLPLEAGVFSQRFYRLLMVP